MSIIDCLKEAVYFETEELSRDLKEKDTMLSSSMFSRSTKRDIIIYYLTSSDQIKIPKQYINLFRVLYRRDGNRLKYTVSDSSALEKFISLGINLPPILLENCDSRGIREILSKMILLGTKDLRKIMNWEPWILSNINNTLEI